ncbi:hypothetical protein [Phenylobacterium sp.]|uniref:hypothetical protein n=1 Tax=Phenylobacterium sp. TaxID=1871053 RepID=UPI0035ADFA58
MSQPLFFKVQIALAGAPLEDAWRVLNDSFAFCIAQGADDIEEIDRLVDIAAGDLKAAVRRYWPELQDLKRLRREE